MNNLFGIGAPEEEKSAGRFVVESAIRQSWVNEGVPYFLGFFRFLIISQHYSRYNRYLVYAQNSEIQLMGSPNFWQNQYERSIAPGARPYVIMVPNGPAGFVYDVLQTQGKGSGEECLKDAWSVLHFEVKTLADNEWPNLLCGSAKREGIYTRTPIGEPLSPNVQFGELLRELAGKLLGHKGFLHIGPIEAAEKDKRFIKERKMPPDAAALEVEATVYLLQWNLKLDNREPEFLEVHLTDKEGLFYFSFREVIGAADLIEKVFLKSLEGR